MHIHILGACGTFMGGVALLARELGYRVTGSDAHVYPPMSTLLASEGIELWEGYEPGHLDPAPDLVVVGNALSRGNPAVEYMLDRGLRYTSGPGFLAEHVLHERWVLAVAGTHGKTTTSSMLAWILEHAGLAPGFLIGGVPENFGVSARLGKTPFFVVEADEYDTAFFDKRSKFVHYRPRTLVLNNLEYDHADIFPDLGAIQRQFHHLVRTVPGQGLLLSAAGDPALEEVLGQGCWTPVQRFGVGGEAEWIARPVSADGSRFEVYRGNTCHGEVAWGLIGDHNMANGLAAIGAACHAGVPPAEAITALAGFANVKRRMELRASVSEIKVYDDFAHHPTAIRTTLGGLRQRVGAARIIAVLEPRSNTMRMGVHQDALAPALAEADLVFLFEPPDLGWDLSQVTGALGATGQSVESVNGLVTAVCDAARPGDHVLIMSNGGFGGLHDKLIAALRARWEPAAAGGRGT